MESSEIHRSPEAKPQKNLITTVNGIHQEEEQQHLMKRMMINNDKEVPVRCESLRDLIPADCDPRTYSSEIECDALRLKDPLVRHAAMAYLKLSLKLMPPPQPVKEEDSHWWSKMFSFRDRQRNLFLGRYMAEDFPDQHKDDDKTNKATDSKVGCIDFFYEVVLRALGFGCGSNTKHS